jgi:hypothetical protein
VSTRHVLLGERIQPSGAQLRKKIKSSRTIKGFRMKPGYLYTVVRAISARVNQNWDGWPSHELEAAHHTFIGKPVFVNHENYDPDKARGVVVASRYVEAGDDKYIEVVQEIDAKRFPLLAHEIKSGGLDSVSMGAEAGHTICSACGNRAVDNDDMCDHVKYHKGEKVRRHNRRTGKIDEVLVYESCHKLGFFELSYVFDPADETAVASKVVMAGRHHGGPTDDYLQQLEDGGPEEEPQRELPTGPAVGGGPSKAQTQWLQKTRKRGSTDLKDIVRTAVLKKAYGEIEAPPAVDTLREEGTAPEDDNDDFHHYVESPDELSMPNLDQAAQLDRQEDETGQPGAAEGGAPPMNPQDDPTKFMTLKIPIPGAGAEPPAPVPPAATPVSPAAPMPAPAPTPQPQVPMQNFARVQARTLTWMERYFGHRVADWRDAIEAGRELTPEEHADFRREAALLTLENKGSVSTTSRNSVKGTANMARNTLATRGKTASAGRRQHFAEGPLTDGGDKSRNDEGEQEEAFITQVPAPDSTDLPDDDKGNISNTEGNLVADEAYAHSLTAMMETQRKTLEATAREYARITGRRKIAEETAGGPVATEVNPEVPVPSAEALTGDNFDSADPNPGVDTSPGGPGTTSLPHESSLQAFQTFDHWLTSSTGRSSRQHSEANIKKAAKQFADFNGVSTQALFPALGIVLRQARKTEAALKAKKGNKMQRRAVDLEHAAPDERVSVPTPVSNTTDAEAQASQFHEDGYANNAGDGIAQPDQSTGQNFAPGEAPNHKASKADGILAMRCAEAMIEAGLEPNTRERKYQLAADFSKMSRGLILDRTALAERFAAVRVADRRKVASGSTRGAALPPGMGSGQRIASVPQQRTAANDPDNDSLLFG